MTSSYYTSTHFTVTYYRDYSVQPRGYNILFLPRQNETNCNGCCERLNQMTSLSFTRSLTRYNNLPRQNETNCNGCCANFHILSDKAFRPSSPLCRLTSIQNHISNSPKDHISKSPTSSSSTSTLETLKQQAQHAIDTNSSSIDKLSMQIWSNPELNYQEILAHDCLTSFLSQQGFKVTPNYLLPTAFLAEFGSGQQPVIVICAEYDALPGIGHACGHNLIASAAVSAAIGIKAAWKGNGTIRILGTPAEEGGQGKAELIKRGAFQDVDVAMMVHPSPADILYPKMPCLRHLVFTFRGKNAHAAGNPWDGINAVDAVVQFFAAVGLARQQMKPTARVHGIITDGGVKPNIIPALTRAEFYIRSPSQPENELLCTKVVACAQGAATATGCTLEWVSISATL